MQNWLHQSGRRVILDVKLVRRGITNWFEHLCSQFYQPILSEFILPEELMMNIWLKLSIKSTARFRCVSKSWCASLSDPQFIFKNLTFSEDAENQNEDDHLLVLDNKGLYTVVSHQTLAAAPPQAAPLPQTLVDYLSIGLNPLSNCCDDLVCFHETSGFGDVLGVWNLTTGETKILPQISHDHDDEPSYFVLEWFGIGFDDRIQDYKIVQIGYYSLRDLKEKIPAVFVYSLRRGGNNCWRKLDAQQNAPPQGHLTDPDYTFWFPCRSYRDGVFYWYDSNHSLMISFDVSSEVFNTTSVPKLPDTFRTLKRICKLKGGGSMFFFVTGPYKGGRAYELWALLEVGATPSLTKLFGIHWRGIDCYDLTPLGIWRNELVFEWRSNHRLLIGDPSSEQEPREVQLGDPSSEQEPKEVPLRESPFVTSSLMWRKGKNSVPLDW